VANILGEKNYYMEKIINDSIKKLNEYVLMVDEQIENNIGNPEALELYIDIRLSLLNEVSRLFKEINKLNTWKAYKG
jgi:hypothetical protein